ncbi:hypothetical protein ACO2Q8_27665 [Larkinella sp. VNQ87]|uniref:hypothetical protein n=1 Tax=Larkinella sp. VNQ87 TaxID=3400921 RepID=UPI003BFCBD46
MNTSRFLPLLLFGLLACSKSTTEITPTDPTTPPVPAVGTPTERGQPAGAPVTKTIGPAGGTLATPDGRFKLVIPAGALSNETPITAQPVENKVHGGTGLAYALNASVPGGRLAGEPPLLTEAQLTLTYTPDDIDGSAPEALGIAYQDQKGVWQGRKKVQLDKAKKTVTVPIDRLAPYAFYEQFTLRSNKNVMAPLEQAALTVYYQLGSADDDDLLAPLTPLEVVSASRLVRWTINGVTDGTTQGDNYANVGQITEDRTWAKGTYDAPGREPDSNPVAIGAELDLKSFGRLTVVKTIRIESVAMLSVGGIVDSNPNVALTVMGTKLMGAIMSASPTARPMVTFTVENFKGKGTYDFPQKGPNITVASVPSGTGYVQGYWEFPGNFWVSGNITLTITEYGGPGKAMRGTIAGSYFDDRKNSIAVSARFRGVPSTIP